MPDSPYLPLVHPRRTGSLSEVPSNRHVCRRTRRTPPLCCRRQVTAATECHRVSAFLFNPHFGKQKPTRRTRLLAFGLIARLFGLLWPSSGRNDSTEPSTWQSSLQVPIHVSTMNCRSEGRAIEERFETLQDLRKVCGKRRHSQHPDRRPTPRVNPPVDQFPAVLGRVTDIHGHAFVGSADARRHCRLNFRIAEVPAQHADLRLHELLQGNSAKQLFAGSHAARKFLVPRLLKSKSFLHLPLGRRCRKRPAHHRERRPSRASPTARTRLLRKLLRNVRRNARWWQSNSRQNRTNIRRSDIGRISNRARQAWNGVESRGLFHGWGHALGRHFRPRRQSPGGWRFLRSRVFSGCRVNCNIRRGARI